VTEPLDAMSLASFGGTTTIKAGNVARIRAALGDMIKQRGASDAVASALGFQHVEFVCNHADTIMTAWALGPEDKAAVMARFLVEAEANSAQLNDDGQSSKKFKRNFDLEKNLSGIKVHLGPMLNSSPLAKKAAEAPASKVAAETVMVNNVIRDLSENELARVDDTSGESQPAQAAPTGKRRGWIYLGRYDDAAHGWTTSYVAMTGNQRLLPPVGDRALTRGMTLMASGRVNVRSAKPTPDATFGAIDAVLQPGSAVELEGPAEKWQEANFYWAPVTY
jgi:hypothetical protein